MILLLVLVVLAFLVYLYKNVKKPAGYPPGPPFHPIVGCSPLLSKLSKLSGGAHLAFKKLAEEYKTSVLGLKLGSENVVVVFSYPIVKKVLTSEEYDGRPDNFFIRLRTMGTKKGITAADGELWVTQRRFVVHHLRDLGFGKGYMEDMIQQELVQILETIKQNENQVNIGQIIPKSVMNVLWAMTAGSVIPEKKLKTLIELMTRRAKLFDASGGILNQFPWLRFVAPNKTGFNLIKEFNRELKNFFLDIINEHLESWAEDRKDDLIYSFITEMKKTENDEYSTFTEEQLMMICVDIFIAGGKTTSTALDFAFFMMALHPEIQEKVHQELNSSMNGRKFIDFNDKHNLPYMKAVLLEVERFCNVVPISGPRRVMKDTILEGYRIKKGTTVLISNYSVHMDEEYWGDPEVFRPERFIGPDGTTISTDRLIPFGLGRRRCFGEALARTCIFIFFAGILKDYIVTFAQESQKQNRRMFVPGFILTPEPYVLQATRKKF